MLEELNRLAKEEKLIVECSNGEEFPIEKVYSVSGRASAIKILVGGEGKVNKLLDKIDDLEDSVSFFEEENKTLTKDLENWREIASTPFEIKERLENLENECDNVQTAIENLEYKLGIKTKCRHTFNRIDELTEILETKIQELENEKNFLEDEISGLKVDNRALAWQIEELEKWKENTLKDENP